MESIWYSCHFIVYKEGCLTPSIYWRKFAFLKSWKCFIPRRDSAKQSPMGSILILSILMWSEKGIWHFQFSDGNSPKKTWLCFIHRRDSAKQNPMGSIWQSFHFIVLGKGVWTFRFRSGNLPSWNPENVLYPEGTLRSRTQWGPFWFFPFYCVWERVFGYFHWR